MHWAIFAILGYVFGSIPFGLVFSRLAGLGDVRKIGSGNIGATNVLRTGNKAIAATTLLADALKGTVPVLIAAAWGDTHAATAAGLAAVAGHMFPVWLGFKGGKGVATGLGVLFGWDWMLGMVFVVSWIAVFVVSKYSSLSALLAWIIVVGVAIAQLEGNVIVIWPIALLTAAIWFMHRANIARLLSGTESTTSFSKKA